MIPIRGYNQGYPPSALQQNQPHQLVQNGQSSQQQQLHLQQQQLQQQQQAQQGASTDAQSISATGPGTEMNLAGVLHYLQSEWRRWERDRNEWEIERAEMRVSEEPMHGLMLLKARIALLEGQRRSAENLKVDMLRRVKMLEFALRQER